MNILFEQIFLSTLMQRKSVVGRVVDLVLQLDLFLGLRIELDVPLQVVEFVQYYLVGLLLYDH